MDDYSAYQRGYDAGYNTANYVQAYGGSLEISYYKYLEASGLRSEYERGWEDGVQAFNDEWDAEDDMF